MCYEVMKLCPSVKSLRLIDVACSEGKRRIFARNGYNGTTFDEANSALEKARQLAGHMQSKVHFFQANMLDFRIEGTFDIIICSGALHYIQTNLKILEIYQNHTPNGGLPALNIFVRKPFVKNPSDEREFRYK